MEPPCEHGGVERAHQRGEEIYLASMEPPCEHGGVALRPRAAPSRGDCFTGAAV